MLNYPPTEKVLGAAIGELLPGRVFLEVRKKRHAAISEGQSKRFNVHSQWMKRQHTEHIHTRLAPELIPDFPRVPLAAQSGGRG